MSIVTYSKDSADWWKAKGVDVSLAFSTDGIDYWSVDVDPDDGELKNPEYVKLVMLEMQEYPNILRQRFAPVLHTVTVGGTIAMMPDKKGKMTFPLSREESLLRTAFHLPDKEQTPKYKALKRDKQILNALKRMATNGIHVVSYFVNDETIETFEIENVVNVLDAKKVVLARADGSIAP